jgi:hypothetical protein
MLGSDWTRRAQPRRRLLLWHSFRQSTWMVSSTSSPPAHSGPTCSRRSPRRMPSRMTATVAIQGGQPLAFTDMARLIVVREGRVRQVLGPLVWATDEDG